MTLGGKRMEPLGQMQWAAILLACGSLVLMLVSIAVMDAQYPTAAPMPLRWLLFAGIAGLIGGGVWVQCTWKTQQGRTHHG